MSLWTPSGEHPVDRRGESQPSQSTQPRPTGLPDDLAEPSLEDLSPEQRAQVEEMARQMEAAQQRMLSLPAGVVIGQQALQFYELAVLYLSQQPPRLDDARLAIDTLAGVVDKVGARLGEAEQPVRQTLHQLQLAFVQLAERAEGAAAGEPAPAGESTAAGGPAATGESDG